MPDAAQGAGALLCLKDTFLAHGQLVPCQDPQGLQRKAAFQPAGPGWRLPLCQSPFLDSLSRDAADPSLGAAEDEGHEAAGLRDDPATLSLFTLRETRLEVILATDDVICLGFANDSSVHSMDWRIEAVSMVDFAEIPLAVQVKYGFLSLKKHMVSVGGRQKGSSAEEDSGACRGVPSERCVLAAPEAQLDSGWHGENDCPLLMSQLCPSSKGNVLTLRHMVQNPLNAS
ncbi:hypothetical protein DUI87_16837 [Hirundo rustica rustica]|uniref:Uncharacterized protein n=1 Tax=Hirundo rustica rustica TaxID=333673 RepID=A0A3M0K2F1_HIRRU|nr:hypothetical protein DUI87_16837 [Hirundo rustica rustica]